MERSKTKGFNWEDFGWEIVNKVSRALDYWCHNVSGDPLLVCYSAHENLSLYDLAQEFVDWVSGITEKDLELLRKMPRKYYDKFDKYIKGEIERVVRNLLEEEMEEERKLS